MKRLRQFLFVVTFGIAGSLAALFLAFTVVDLTDPGAQAYREFEQRFLTVSPGDNREKVVELLGKPDDVDGDFRLGQVEGHEDAYERARISGAVEYAFWFRGIDVVFAIGFDENDKVAVIGHGGT